MRQHPLSFLFLLAVLFALPNISFAQMAEELVDSLDYQEERQAPPVEQLRRVEQLTSYGPHYKNPLAAGRLLVVNRADDARPAPPPPRLNLLGPAYKNRRPDTPEQSTAPAPRAKKERRFGPRYKNRGAKTGGG